MENNILPDVEIDEIKWKFQEILQLLRYFKEYIFDFQQIANKMKGNAESNMRPKNFYTSQMCESAFKRILEISKEKPYYVEFFKEIPYTPQLHGFKLFEQYEDYAFKNCSYEGRIIRREQKQLVETVSNSEDEHVNSIKALNVEMETLKNQLFEKDQKIAKLIDTAKFQNETHKKKLELFEEKVQSFERLTQKLEKEKAENVEKEAEKKFETWKNEYQKNHDSIINKQKQLIKKICENTDEKRPLWLVPQNICDAICQSHQKSFDLFVSSYIKELFSMGEIILPQRKLNHKKINEAFFNALEEALNKKRCETRQLFYQKVQKNGIIAINKIGEYYFYGSDTFGKFIPFKDSQCTEPMNATVFHGRYGIPDEYRNDGFILIIHISPADGIFHNYLHAESGYLERNIHTVSKIVKTEKV